MHIAPCSIPLLQARYAAQAHEATQRATQLKAELLEEQLSAAAASAARHMQEQLDSFRGDAAVAK